MRYHPYDLSCYIKGSYYFIVSYAQLEITLSFDTHDTEHIMQYLNISILYHIIWHNDF